MIRAALRTAALLALLLAVHLFIAPPGSRAAPAADGSKQAGRAVAITFDDLPGASPGLLSLDVESVRGMTRKLLDAIDRQGVPAAGMVTTRNAYVSGETEAQTRERLELVGMWLDAGLEIGNHTHSHPDLNKVPLKEFQENVLRAEREMAPILGPDRRMRYFRHPMLHVGLELEKRRAFEHWLDEAGYTIAPVTMDNDDYIYAAAYATALRRGDAAAAKRLGEDYLRYMEQVVAFWEEVEEYVVGRPIRHVLLLHASQINADHFDALAAMMKRRGYRFVGLKEALEDEAYRMPDTWAGKWGLSWLHRWALTAGKKRLPDPDPPQWVMKAFQERDRS